MAYRNTHQSISLRVDRLIHSREIFQASRNMPAHFLAQECRQTKYIHEDIIDDIDLARTVLTMLKLRDDRGGRDMARYLEWLLLKTETRDRRQSAFRFEL